jgi:glycerophosphoryl diester phosphodiesterase
MAIGLPGRRRPLRVAHRGYRGYAPDAPGENTLAAFRRAIALGAECIETDVRLRRSDGALVLSHDGGDLGRAATLADLCDLVRDTDVSLNLDVKETAVLPSLIRLVEDRGLLRRIVLTGGSWSALVEARRAHPGLRVGLTIPRRTLGSVGRLLKPVAGFLARRRYAATAPRLIAHYGVDLVTVNHRLVSRRLVERVHAAGGEVWTWTVASRAEALRVTIDGVDGICVDDPALHGLSDG